MNPTGIRIFEFVTEQNESFLEFIEVVFVNKKHGKALYLNLIDDIYGNLLSTAEYRYEFLYINEYGNSDWVSQSDEEFKKLVRREIDIDFRY